MFKINKIILLFFTVIFVVLVGLWEGIHSQALKNKILVLGNSILKERAGIEINIEALDFDLFPVQLHVKGLSLAFGEKLKSYIQQVDLEFSFLDSFNTKFTIDKITINDGYIKYQEGVNKKEPKKQVETSSWREDIRKILIKIIETNEKLPIRFNYLVFRDFTTVLNEKRLEIKYLDTSVDNEKIGLNLNLQNVELKKFLPVEETIDSLALSLWIQEKRIDVKSFSITKDFSRLKLTGKINDYLDEMPSLDINSKLVSDVSLVNKYVDLKKIGKIEQGAIQVNILSKGLLNNLEHEIKLSLEHLISQFVNADKVKALIGINGKEIRFTEFDLVQENQLLKLLTPFQFYDFDKRKFIEEIIVMEAKEFELNNALRFLGKPLEVLKGRVSGEVKFALRSENFEFIAQPGTIVSDVKLVAGENEILHVPSLVVDKKASFLIDKGRFIMNLPAKIKENQFLARGIVEKNNINFKVNDGQIDLNDWGPIAGLPIKGRGDFNFKTIKNNKSLNLIIETKLKDFNLIDYQLEKLESSILINLEKQALEINLESGSQGKLQASGKANISLNDLSIDSNINVNTTNIKDLKTMLNPIFKDLTVVPDKIWGTWKTQTQISGKLNIDDLIVKTKVQGVNNFIFDESFSVMNFDLFLRDKVLSFENIDLRKQKGEIRGEYFFNLTNKKMKYNLEVSDLPLDEITNYTKLPLNLSANAFLTVRKESYVDEKINAHLSLKKSKLGARDVEDTRIVVEAKNESIKLSLNAFGEKILINSQVILDKKEMSFIELKINSDKVEELLALTKLVDIRDSSLEGAINLEAKSVFDKWNLIDGNHQLRLSKFQLKKDNIKIDYRNDTDNIVIKKAKVEKWNFNYIGADFSVTSDVSGNFLHDYNVESRFKVNAKFLEIFNSIISQASGVIRGKMSVNKKFDNSAIKVLAFTRNLKFSSPLSPVDVENTDFEISYADRIIQIKKLEAKLAKGSISTSGRISLREIFPDINLRFKLNSAYLPIKNKSELIVSGSGVLVGNNFPYNLTGSLNVESLSIRNEFVEFIESNSVAFKKDYDFLPESKNKFTNRYFNFNFDIKSPNTIKIKNSLASLVLGGSLNLTGGESDVYLLGSLNLAPGYHYATFKNNEYVFKKLSVSFLENRKIYNPDIDVNIISNIDKYRVNAKVLGAVNDFNVDLTSEPFLSKESILSLIAFGYTEDLSTNLNDKEKEAMTQAGVGSILFDSFKINETLKDELGLEVNLGTEIRKDEGSYLAGKTAADNSVGRVRSATTVEIKKTITDEMSLSVSSTLGGTIGQRQSMNLNYNINNKVSLEGVYETRTNNEGENINVGNSLGADLKFKWSFK